MSAVAIADSGSKGLQKHLIPPDACCVRYAMLQAEAYGVSENIFYAHVVSVAFAIGAVVMSAFNALSYLLLIPSRALVNIVSFSPKKLFENMFLDVTYLARSVLFVSLGVTFIVAGSLLPTAIFTFFAPEYWQTKEVRLEEEVSRIEKENQELKKELKKKEEDFKVAAAKIQEQQGKKWGFGPFW